MNVEEFRDYCMSLPDVTEKMPFGKFTKRFESTLVFYVKNHMFCLVDIHDFTFVEMKATPEEMTALVNAHEAVTHTINPVLKDWIHVTLEGDLTDKEIYDLVDKAYFIILAKYPG